MVEPCVICQIVREEVPAWIVYQTDTTVCFLPKDLNTIGHTIIAPKEHYTDLFTLPEQNAGDLMCVAKALTGHYASVLDAVGVNLLHASGKAAQQSVMHFHFHLLPRYHNDEIDAWPTLENALVDKDELLMRIRVTHIDAKRNSDNS